MAKRKKAEKKPVENAENQEAGYEDDGAEGGEGLATVADESTPVPLGEETEGKELRKKALETRNTAQNAYWELGECLFAVYEDATYQSWGFKTFQDYVSEELDFEYRTARYLIKLRDYLKNKKAELQEWFHKMGWTKARMLMGVVTEENFADWKARCDGKTVAEIEKILKDAAEDDDNNAGNSASGDGKETTKKMSFAFYAEQYENVEKAIKLAKEKANTDKASHALDLICTEFSATTVGVDSIQGYLESVERFLGVQIVAYDREDDAIVFGEDLINELDAEGDDEDEAAEE